MKDGAFAKSKGMMDFVQPSYNIRRSHSSCEMHLQDKEHFSFDRSLESRRPQSVADGVELVLGKLNEWTMQDEVDSQMEIPSSAFEHKTVQLKEGSYGGKYAMKELIASGRFGTVYSCEEKATGLALAAKCFRKKTKLLKLNALSFLKRRKPPPSCIKNCMKRQECDEEDVIREMMILNQIDHPNIVKLYDAYKEQSSIVLIMEHVSGGELFDRIIDNVDPINEYDSILYMRQIVSAVQYLHKNMIMHLDLKPENILLVNRNSHQLKLIDFGLSRRYNPRDSVRVQLGTIEFMAPEIVAYEPISTATDMWSVGVIAFILCTGSSPFLGDTNDETLTNISSMMWDYESMFFSKTSEDSRDFVQGLLVNEKSGRMSASQCLEHDWLSKSIARRRYEDDGLDASLISRIQWKASVAVVQAANWLYKTIVPSREESVE